MKHLRFDGFELVGAAELRRAGARVPLPPQPLRLLATLAARPGEIVGRDELRRALWGDLHVDHEHGLNFAVRQVRTALGDSADEPRFVETIPKVGYRFVAAVEVVAPPPPQTDGATRRRHAAAAGTLLAVVTVGLAIVARPAPPRTVPRVLVGPLGGVSDSVVDELARLPPEQLLVLAPTTAAAASDPRELGVTHVVDGRAEGDALRVRLTRLADGQVAWAGRLTLDAWTGARAARAVALALEAGPTLAPRRAAGLAEPHLAEVERWRRVHTPEAAARWRVAAEAAVAADPEDARGHLALAAWRLYRGRDVEGSRAAFERALALSPGSAAVHDACAGWFAAQGRHDEALAHARRAAALDPLSTAVQLDLGWYLYLARRYDESVAVLERAHALREDPGCLEYAARSRLAQDRPAEALDFALRAMELRAADAGEIARVRAGGIAEYLRWDVRRLVARGADPALVALDHAWLGDGEAARALLDTSRAIGGSWVHAFVGVEPAWDRLRSRAVLVILRGGSWARLLREVEAGPASSLARLRRAPLPALDGSVTAAAMGSLLTGSLPERHGLVGNVFREGFAGAEQDAFEAPLLAEPLWEAVERQGRHAAVVNVRLPGHRHHGVHASLVPRLAAPAPDLAGLLEKRVDAGAFVGKVLQAADERREVVGRLLADPAWDLLVVDENVLDALGHPFGATSPEAGLAWGKAEQLVGAVSSALPANSTLAVVSPYGMAPVHGAVPLGGRLATAGLGDRARVAAYGPIAHVYLAPGADAQAVMHALRGEGVARIESRASPRLPFFHPRRGGDLVVLATPGFVLSSDGAGARPRFPADHGHAGDTGFLMWSGPDGLPSLRVIDVAPTVLGFMGLRGPVAAQGVDVRAPREVP